MKTTQWILVLVISLALAACAPAATTAITPSASPTLLVQQTPAPAGAPAALDRTDDQGAVQVKVTPLNLAAPGETLDFEVSMNTHSVGLSMNLAELATLITDSGRTVVAVKWEAPAGGHHIVGKLQFPSSADGESLLKGATRLTLSLRNVDAPERVFAWELK